MSNNDLLFTEIKKKIEKKFIKSGWVTLYANERALCDVDEGSIYSALIDTSLLRDSLSKYEWDLHLGNGMPGPCFYEEKVEYSRFGNEGIEPLVFYRNFHGIKSNYLELSEEFRLYFNLYELYENEKNKKYIFINNNGDEEKVAYITNNKVEVMVKFIKEYISIRKMALAIFFSFTNYSKVELNELNLNKKDKTFYGKDYIYNHLLRDISYIGMENKRTQSWMIGKIIIHGIKNYKPSLIDYFEDRRYEKFLIGLDEEGNKKYFTCEGKKLSNYFEKNSDAPNYLTPVYFSKEVLNKYYDNPQKYTVEDGYIHCAGLWSLRIDNNHHEYVTVFLGDLGNLHNNEQLHWKAYNISPKNGISKTAYKRNILGEFTDPESLDLYFKQRYNQFSKKWYRKYYWHLFKPLSEKDEHHFKSLHIPSPENQKEFDAQILSLTKILIDSLNEKELTKNTTCKKNAKGIDKLEIFLKNKGAFSTKMIEFLRNLQSLRSTSVAHRKSSDSKRYKKINKYFEIDKKSLKEIFEEILLKSIWTLNFLEKYFLNN